MANSDTYCRDYSRKNPHISAETAAYYLGRDAGAYGGKCGLSDKGLVAAWHRGFRSVRAEMRLDADTEWDA